MTTPENPGARRLALAVEDTGEVRIGSPSAAPAGFATVPISGGTVYVDPAAADAPPAAVLADVDQAAAAIELLYGRPAAAAITDRADVSDIGVVPTDAAARITRLGILRWLRATSPLRLDDGLLVFETAVAVAGCADLLPVEDEPAPTLEDLGEVIVALARSLRGASNRPWVPGLTDLVEEALNGVMQGSSDGWLVDDARHEAELRQAMATWEVSVLDWDRWDELARSARPEAAVHAGPEDASRPRRNGDRLRGTGSVDWSRVPVGIVDPSEGTVTWVAGPARGDRLVIEVEVRGRSAESAHADLADVLASSDPAVAGLLRRLSTSRDEPRLMFHLYIPGFGLPVGAGTLRRADHDGSWRGAAEIPRAATAAGDVLVDVHSATIQPGPRRGASAVLAQGNRWATRGLALLRLSLGAAGVADDVRAPLERARQLFATVSAAPSDGTDQPDLGKRAAARCDALMAAYALRHGDSRGAERGRARLARAGSELPADDTLPPDLTSPRWMPTVAERALMPRGD